MEAIPVIIWIIFLTLLTCAAHITSLGTPEKHIGLEMSTIRLGALLMMTLTIKYGGTFAKSATPEWKRKMGQFFDMINVDQDGYVTKEEYVDLTAQRAEEVLPSWRAKAVYGIMAEQFPIWWSNNMTNYATSVSREAFFHSVEVLQNQLASISPENRWEQDWFHTVDLDCNEQLNVDEYAKFLKIFRNTASVETIFRTNDRDKNGIVDLEEFGFALRHFDFDEDLGIGDLAYGSME